MSARIRLALALGALAFGCSCRRPLAPVPGPLPEPKPDPYQPAIGPCETFCVVTARLGCPQAEPGPGQDELNGTADDTPCIDVCKTLIASGHFPADEVCMNAATTCDRAETCLMGE